jgi:acyl-CoA thioesterase
VIVQAEGRIGPGPFSEHLGFRVVALDTDEVVLAGTPGAEHCNSGGIVHGGYLAALLDSATGWAVHVNIEAGIAAPHLQLGVQYLRAAVPGEDVECRARCLTIGRRIVAAEGAITQSGRLVAKAASTHLVDR